MTSAEHKAAIDAWIEMYIKQDAGFKSGIAPTASRLNELFNLLINQGDNAATAISHIRDFFTAYMVDIDAKIATDIETEINKWAAAKNAEVDAAVQTANTANTNANNAVTTANAANAAATQAVTNANTATTAANNAANSANNATDKANLATMNANSARDAANSAATSANNAASAANTAKSAADTATANANSATTAANNAASSANTAASNTNIATTAANNAASAANTAKTNADTATTNANNAATAANTAKNNAVTATTNANTATTNANNAATSANNAATAATNAMNSANTAEQSRVTAEQGRVSAENTRAALYSGFNDRSIPAAIENRTGAFIQSIVADDMVNGVELKVNGATTVTPANANLDISPDNVATIVNAKNFDVVACGKNLIPFPYTETTKTLTGITFTVNTDGSITVNGTATAQTDFYLVGSFSAEKSLGIKNGDYYLSGGAGINSNLKLRWISGSYNGDTISNSGDKITYSNTIKILIRVTSGATISNVKVYPQLEVGSSATTYEVYKGNKLTLTQELAKLPNGVADTIEPTTDGKWKFVQRIGKVVFDGSADETVFAVVVNATTIRFHNYASGYKIGAYVVTSDKFKYYDTASTDDEKIFGHNSSQNIDITIKMSRLTTQDVAGFKAWLSSNPVTVYYELATPTETILDTPLKLTTYKGLTNLFTSANPQVKLEANFKGTPRYTYDYFENKTALAVVDTQSGAFIQSTVADDLVGGVELTKVEGNSYQLVTTQGKNLYNNNTVQNLASDDTGATFTSSTRLLSDYISVSSLNAYTYTHSNPVCMLAAYLEYTIDKVFIKRVVCNSTTSMTFTTSDTVGYVRLYFSHTTNTTVIDKTLTQNEQFELGSISTSFEPFTPNSPSPDYPASITSAGDTPFDVVVSGKNLLPKTDKLATTVNGITFTPNSNGTITVNGTSTAIADFYLYGAYGGTTEIFKLPKGTYTLKGTGNANVIFNYGKTSAAIQTASSSDNTVTTTVDNSVVFAFIRVNSGVTVSNLIVYPQLEASSVSTAYEPYKSNKLSILLPVRRLPNGVKDTLTVTADGYLKHTQYVGKIVLDGSADEGLVSVQIGTSGYYRYRLSVSNLKNSASNVVANGYCSHFKFVSADDTYLRKQGIATTSTDVYIYITSFENGDLTGFKTWLASNPITVLYELATPVETILDTKAQLTTYKGVTNAFTTANPQPLITGTFKSRLKNIHEVINGMPATNLVVNGDFRDGTVGCVTSSATVSANNGEGTILFSSNAGYVHIYVPIKSGDKYYARCNLKADSSAVKFSVTDRIAYEYGIYHKGDSAYSVMSLLYTAQATNPNGAVRFFDGRTSGWTNFNVKNIFIIDLTEIFGAGNEPTLAEMDAILSKYPNSWFNGTVNPLLTHKELLTYLNKGKANIKQEDYITPTLTGGATFTADSDMPLRYWKDSLGYTHIIGKVCTVLLGSSNPFCTLVAGYKPSKLLWAKAQTNTGYGEVVVQNTGAMYLRNGGTSYVWVDIIFKAEQ